MHPPHDFDRDLLKLFLISEIFPYELLKVYEMGEEEMPRTLQFSKKIPRDLLEVEKARIESRIKKALEAMQHPKKRAILKAARKKLEELKKNPEANKREIELLLMRINEILFHL